jgi:hypothetical protein
MEKESQNLPQELGDNCAEKVIAVVAKVVLILGCLVSFVALVGMMFGPSWEPSEPYLITFFGAAISSVITWASLMVIANISNNIRQIKHLLKDRG